MMRPFARPVPAFALLFALASASCPSHADGDRERAQLLQMQQQLQRLQSDNASLQRERSQLQDKVKEAEQQRDSVGKDLARTKVQASSASQDATKLREELDALHAQDEQQLARWKAALEERDNALQAAAQEHRKMELQVAFLGARLKAQTGRADLCETKHAEAMKVGGDLIEAYANKRLRWYEPVTGLRALHEQDDVQAWRDRLYEARLDVPLPAAPANSTPASAKPEAAAAAPAAADTGKPAQAQDSPK